MDKPVAELVRLIIGAGHRRQMLGAMHFQTLARRCVASVALNVPGSNSLWQVTAGVCSHTCSIASLPSGALSRVRADPNDNARPVTGSGEVQSSPCRKTWTGIDFVIAVSTTPGATSKIRSPLS